MSKLDKIAQIINMLNGKSEVDLSAIATEAAAINTLLGETLSLEAYFYYLRASFPQLSIASTEIIIETYQMVGIDTTIQIADAASGYENSFSGSIKFTFEPESQLVELVELFYIGSHSDAEYFQKKRDEFFFE